MKVPLANESRLSTSSSSGFLYLLFCSACLKELDFQVVLPGTRKEVAFLRVPKLYASPDTSLTVFLPDNIILTRGNRTYEHDEDGP